MKNLLLLFLLISTTSYSQSVVSQRLPKGEKDLEPYNLKLDNVYLDFQYDFTVGHDNNPLSATTETSREESAYMINSVNVGIYSPLSEDFSIDTSFELGYRNWYNDDLKDGLIFDARSGDTLAFDWRINENITLSLVDRLTMNVESVQDQKDNEGSDEQRMLKNDLGLQFFHELTEESSYGFKMGYNYIQSLNNENEERDRDDYYVGVEFNQKLSQVLTLSPYALYREYDYDVDQNNDGDEWQVGTKLSLIASETVYTELSLGVQSMDFEGDLEEDDETDLMGSLLISHTISEMMNHYVFVSYGKRASVAPSINFSSDWLLSYKYSWQINQKLKIAPGVTWFISEDEVPDGEEYDLLMPEIGLVYDITEKLGLSLDYKYTNKNSNTPREYNRTNLSLSLTYDF